MSLRTEQSRFAEDIVRLLTWASSAGYEYTFGEFQRPVEMQRIHYNAGRSKTMNSLHIKKLAADIFFFLNGNLLSSKEDMQPIGNYWETLGAKNSWGGNWKSFKDIPHFERRST